jgi:hypothetical protein
MTVLVIGGLHFQRSFQQVAFVTRAERKDHRMFARHGKRFEKPGVVNGVVAVVGVKFGKRL